MNATTPFEDGEGSPLTGLRVLDLTRLAAGNMLTHMLADFGADVIKIERPGVGDDLRRFGKHESWWKEYSRSKRSLSLNPNSDEGREVLLKLVKTADVLVENFVPGTLEKWGLGPDKLMERSPDLVIVRVSGWGQTGPYAHKPGFGSLIEGMSGFAAMAGFADREPLLPPLALADMIAGLAGYGGVLAALRARDQGLARGQVVDLSLFEPLFSILGPMATAYEIDGSVPKRSGNWGDVAAPRNVYECADGGYVTMSATMQSMWEKLANAIERPDLVTDPRFLTNPDRVQNRVELEAIVGAFFAQRTVAENLIYFEEREITVGPICDIADLMAHPYIQGREVVRTYADPDHGALPMHAPFPRLSKTPATVRTPAPLQGQNSDEVLAEIGLTSDQIATLRDKGIV
jgi:crotonobetainyl-CoA:carnitine CoA-transferase CaiB-like acyl-CoA transferase